MQATGAAKRILIVEDEEDQAATFAEILAAAGYEVTIAADGFDALEKTVAGEFDLITMDLRMPRLGGIGAMELLRHRRAPVPVIVISGYLSAHEEELERMGVRYALQKPVDLEELLATVRRALAGA